MPDSRCRALPVLYRFNARAESEPAVEASHRSITASCDIDFRAGAPLRSGLGSRGSRRYVGGKAATYALDLLSVEESCHPAADHFSRR